MDARTLQARAGSEVLARYGLLKTAENPLRWLFREHPHAYDRWYTAVPEVAREIYLGSPVTHAHMIADLHRQTQSLPKTYGALAKAFYFPRAKTPWEHIQRGLGLAFSAADLYGAVANGPANRYGDLASAATGLALNPILSRGGYLLGAPLQMGAMNLARRLGHRFDPPSEEPPFVPAPTLGASVRRTMRGAPMANTLNLDGTGASAPTA